MVEVQTEAIGLSAEEVQSLITLNLEELLSGVPWLQSIRSQSVTGLSSIVLAFKRGTDIMKARQMIQERLTLAYTLPNVAQPPVILQPVSATCRFMMIGITSDKVEPTELSLLARWTIKPRLIGVPGVANVAIWGQRLRQMHVQIDPNRLRDARVMQEDIIAAAGDALWVSPLTFLKGSAPGTGGWIDNPNQRLGVQHTMPIETPEDMAKVAVTTPHLLLSGKTLSLGDVAELTFSHPPLIGDAVARNGSGLILVVEKFPSTNTLEVTRSVDQALAELSRGLPGVQIDTRVYRLASYVDDSIAHLTQAIILGGVLVILVIGAFLYSWRSALISAVSIALTLLAALAALHLTGATINTMILAGLIVALTVVIDDVVVDTEMLRERLRAHSPDSGMSSRRSSSPRRWHRNATRSTRPGRGARRAAHLLHGRRGGLVLRAAGHRVCAGGGRIDGGRTDRDPRAQPDAAGARGRPERESPVRRLARQQIRLGLAQAHRRAAQGGARGRRRGAGRHRHLAAARAVAAAEPQGAGAAGELVHAPGTSHAETHRITSRVSRELRSLPGVRSVGAHVGRAVTGDQVVGINSSQIWISIDPKADYDKTVAAIRETVEGYPGIEHSVRSYLRDKVSEVLTGAGQRDRRAHLRPEDRGPASEGRGSPAGDLRDQGIVDLRPKARWRNFRCRSRWTSTPRVAPTSSPAMCGAPRRPSLPAWSSAICSRSRRSSRWWCTVRPRLARA